MLKEGRFWGRDFAGGVWGCSVDVGLCWFTMPARGSPFSFRGWAGFR
jgi:hypothetical protein